MSADSRSNLNILSEARVRAPELISHQISADPIDEKLCPLWSVEKFELRRRWLLLHSTDFQSTRLQNELFLRCSRRSLAS
jgi:hypothetical protein